MDGDLDALIAQDFLSRDDLLRLHADLFDGDAAPWQPQETFKEAAGGGGGTLFEQTEVVPQVTLCLVGHLQTSQFRLHYACFPDHPVTFVVPCCTRRLQVMGPLRQTSGFLPQRS